MGRKSSFSMSVCMSAVLAGISEVLIKYTGKYVDIYFIMKITFSPFRLFVPLRRCPFFLRGLLRKSRTPGLPFLLSPFLQKGGMRGGGRSRGALVLLPEGLPLLPLDFVQQEGWRSLWSLVRCTRARFCLLGSFVDWGSSSCSLAADSCYPICPGWFSLLISARPAR